MKTTRRCHSTWSVRVIRGCVVAAFVSVFHQVPVHAELSAYTWKSRVVIIFAPSRDDARYRRQVGALLTRSTELRDRDMVVIAVHGSRASVLTGRATALNTAALRKRYGVSRSGFRTLLLGKDGGIKLSRSTPVSSTRIFMLIDSMPMRRQEIRQRDR